MCWNLFVIVMLTFGILRFFWRILRYLSSIFLLANRLVFHSGTRQTPDVVERASDPRFEVLIGLFLAALLMLVAIYIGFWQPLGTGSHWIAIALLAAGVGIYVVVAHGAFRLPSAYLPDQPPMLPRERIQQYEIRLPQRTAWNGEPALHLIEQLAHACPDAILQIEADEQSIRWWVVNAFREIHPGIIPEIVRSVYPEAVVYPPTEGSRFPDGVPFWRYHSFYTQTTDFIAPLRGVGDLKAFDPLVVLMQAADSLESGTRLTFVLALGNRAEAAYREAERQMNRSTPRLEQWFSLRGVQAALENAASRNAASERYSAQQRRTLAEKQNGSLYYAAYFVQMDAPDLAHLFRLVGLVNGVLTGYAQPGYNRLGWVSRDVHGSARQIVSREADQQHDVLARIARWRDPREHDERPSTLVLDAQEIAALWHLPNETFSASRIVWAARFVPITETIARVSDGTVLGIGKYHGTPRNVRLPPRDRYAHQSIIGMSGTGKSTLMLHQIRQDILDGYGLAVIDPHGSLIQQVLQTCIPERRRSDVVVLDLANHDYPPPLNPLIGNTSYTGMLYVVSLLEHLYRETEHSARISSTLRAALLPLQHEPQPTMRDVVRMFSDPVFRERMLNQTNDSEVLEFWSEYYDQLSPQMQRQVAAPVFHRIRVFYANPYLYPVVCHPQAVDFHEFIQKRKILLISLAINESLVPKQERDLLGALLISRLQLSGMAEVNALPFFLYIDEAQRFVTTSLAQMLSEARKHNLSLVLAHQYLAQLQGETLQAVMGNVSTQVTFRCSSGDAQAVIGHLKPQIEKNDLENLSRHHAVVKMQVNGVTQPAFHLLTLPPPSTPPDAHQQELRTRQESITHYTPLSRVAVLAWLNERYGTARWDANPAPAGDEARFYE